MTWLRKDDRFAEHRKIRRLSDAAYRLHDEGLLACARDETDGRLTPDDLDEIPHGKRLGRYVDELEKAGLWEPREAGWTIHDFLDFNPSHEEMEADREASRKRQAAFRERRRNAVSNGVTNGDVTRESQHPARPVPSRPSRPVPVKDSGSPHASNVTSVTRDEGDA